VSSRTRVGQADAAVAQAPGECRLKAIADLARIEPLAIQNRRPGQQQLDAARAAATAGRRAQLAFRAGPRWWGADARVAAASASRDQAALQLSYTHMHARIDGVVSKKAVEIGQLCAGWAAADDRRPARGTVGWGCRQTSRRPNPLT